MLLANNLLPLAFNQAFVPLRFQLAFHFQLLNLLYVYVQASFYCFQFCTQLFATFSFYLTFNTFTWHFAAFIQCFGNFSYQQTFRSFRLTILLLLALGNILLRFRACNFFFCQPYISFSLQIWFCHLTLCLYFAPCSCHISAFSFQLLFYNFYF